MRISHVWSVTALVFLVGSLSVATTIGALGRDDGDRDSEEGLLVAIQLSESRLVYHAPGFLKVAVSNQMSEPLSYNARGGWTVTCESASGNTVESTASPFVTGVCEHRILSPGDSDTYILPTTQALGGLPPGRWSVRLTLPPASGKPEHCTSPNHDPDMPIGARPQAKRLVSNCVDLEVSWPTAETDVAALRYLLQVVKSTTPTWDSSQPLPSALDLRKGFTEEGASEQNRRLEAAVYAKARLVPIVHSVIKELSDDSGEPSAERSSIAQLLSEHRESVYARETANMMCLALISRRHCFRSANGEFGCPILGSACEQFLTSHLSHTRDRWRTYDGADLLDFIEVCYSQLGAPHVGDSSLLRLLADPSSILKKAPEVRAAQDAR